MKFYWFNLLFVLLPMLPNILFFLKRPSDVVSSGPIRGIWRLFETLERVGQLGCFVLPLFFAADFDRGLIFALGMAAALSFYYIGWVRYFIKGRRYNYLFKPMLGIPVPLAISPVVYFLFTALLIHSVWMFAAVLLLAAGHIPISLKSHLLTSEKKKGEIKA